MNKNLPMPNVVDTEAIDLALKKRTVVFNKDFTTKYVEEFIGLLEKIERYDVITNNKNKRVTIKIDSFGGQVFSLLTLMSKIEEMKANGYVFTTHTYGTAMSCGFILHCIGDIKLASKYATLLNHQSSGLTYGTLGDMEVTLEEFKRHEEIFTNFLLENTKMTLEEIQKPKDKNKDIFYSAQEGVEKGFVDRIV